MKKIVIILLFIFGFGATGAAMFFAETSYAARGTGSSCTSDDYNLFPFGFFCGGSGGYREDVTFIGSTPSNNREMKTGSTFTIETNVSPDGTPRSEPGGAAREVLVWTTIDAGPYLASEMSIYGESGPGNSNSSTWCPGTSGRASPYQPGIVFGHTDGTPGSYGSGHSPYAYGGEVISSAFDEESGSLEEGFVNCKDYGRMVHWTNASSNNGNYRFTIRTPDNRQGKICVRTNVSVRFPGDTSHFPAPRTSTFWPGSDQNVVASHIAKSSERRCYNIKNEPPTGTLNISCTRTSYRVSGYDRDWPAAGNLFGIYRVNSNGTETRVDYGETSRNDTRNRSYSFSSGTNYKLYLYDRDTEQWVFITGQEKTAGGGVCGGGTTEVPRPIANRTCTRFEQNVVGNSIYRFTVFYGNDEYLSPTAIAPGTVQIRNAEPTNWAGYTAAAAMQRGPVNTSSNDFYRSGSVTKTVVDGNAYFFFQGFDYENVPPIAQFRKVYIEHWEHGENAAGQSTWTYKRSSTLNNDCGSPQLSAGSSTGSYVEIGTQTEFDHRVYNSGTKDSPQDWYNGRVDYNYFVDDVAAGQLSEWQLGNTNDHTRPAVAVGANARAYPGSWQLAVPGDTPTGSSLCQRYSVWPITDENPNSSTADPIACVVVVGGKSYLTTTRSAEYIEPTETVNFSTSVVTNSFAAHGAYTGYGIGCSYNMSVKVYPSASPTPAGSGACGATVSGNGSVVTANVPYTVGLGIPIGSEICFTATISSANPALLADGYAVTQTQCANVVAKPYVKAYGGDMVAGNGFTGDNCVNSNASIISWDKNNGAAGSGTNLAAFAQGVIQGFGSGQGTTSGTSANGFTSPPNNFSFANNPTPASSYGGNFGSGTCIPDYYGNRPTDMDPWSNILAANVNPEQKAFTATGRIELSGGTLATAADTRLYVDGDVYISQNIYFDETTAITDVSNVPRLTVVAKGNIYIAPSVNKLYGTFVAQGSGTNSGNIYTCANSDYTPYQMSNTNYDRCNNRLIVVGSFVANKVHLLRTAGSLYQDGGERLSLATDAFGRLQPNSSGYNGAAEIFVYNPLIWFRSSSGNQSGENIPIDIYDSATALPPVL